MSREKFFRHWTCNWVLATYSLIELSLSTKHDHSCVVLLSAPALFLHIVLVNTEYRLHLMQNSPTTYKWTRWCPRKKLICSDYSNTANLRTIYYCLGLRKYALSPECGIVCPHNTQEPQNIMPNLQWLDIYAHNLIFCSIVYVQVARRRHI